MSKKACKYIDNILSCDSKDSRQKCYVDLDTCNYMYFEAKIALTNKISQHQTVSISRALMSYHQTISTANMFDM